MFSVITQQEPRDAELIFSMLRPCAERLYFTALVDDGVDGYVEKDPERPRNMSAYSPALIGECVTRAGWRIDNVYPPARFQQTAFICRRK